MSVPDTIEIDEVELEPPVKETALEQVRIRGKKLY